MDDRKKKIEKLIKEELLKDENMRKKLLALIADDDDDDTLGEKVEDKLEDLMEAFRPTAPSEEKFRAGVAVKDKPDTVEQVVVKIRKDRRLLFAIIGVAALLILFFSGYKSAADKYQTEIDALQAELDDRAAVFEEIDTKVDVSVISNEVQSIGELASMEYLYTDAGQFSDPRQIFGMDIPFTTKSFVAKWDGVIKAGIDVTQIAVTVDESTKTITIHLPPAQILSHEIGDNIETLDQEDGLFNPITVDDVREFDNLAKQDMEERAIENGLLEKADENARAIIESLLNADSIIRDNYQVVFEPLG